MLLGHAIPRSDLPDHASKYAVVMLALFKPWERSTSNLLKAETIEWSAAWEDWSTTSLTTDKQAIVDHMQEQWECKKAADLYSLHRKKRFANSQSNNGFMSVQDLADELVNDMDWQLGQAMEPSSPEYGLDGTDGDEIGHCEACGDNTQHVVEYVNALANSAGFYGVCDVPGNVSQLLPDGFAVDVGEDGKEESDLAFQKIANERAEYLDKRRRGKFGFSL